MNNLEYLSTVNEATAFREYDMVCLECNKEFCFCQGELEEQDYQPVCDECNYYLHLTDEETY